RWRTMSSHAAHQHDPAPPLTRMAVQATLHCLTGCAIGEVLGMVVATAVGLGDVASIILSVVLAFAFGYGLTIRPVLRAGVPPRRAARVALPPDTRSIPAMGVVAHAVLLLRRGPLAPPRHDTPWRWGLVGAPAL